LHRFGKTSLIRATTLGNEIVLLRSITNGTRNVALEKQKFIKTFRQFNENLRNYNGSQFESFTTGVPAKWEGYKPIVRGIAIERLRADSWSPDDIGSGKILAAVIHAIEIRESQEIREVVPVFRTAQRLS